MDGLTLLGFLCCVSFPFLRRLFLKILVSLCRAYKEQTEGFIPAKTSKKRGMWTWSGGGSRQDRWSENSKDEESLGKQGATLLPTHSKPLALMSLPLLQ